MAAKRKAKELTVTATQQLSKNMLRLTMQGPDLASFPENAEGAYFKLAFPGGDADKPIMRTYTVSKHRPAEQEIDVDFMLHGGSNGQIEGVAAAWAMQAVVGDKASLFGPGLATFINTDADWFLLAADMTALPALTANLALLPQDARGHIVVEILSEEDQQVLPVPSNMELHWVINPQAGSDASPLNAAIEELPWLDGQVSIWAACEFKTMKKIRHYYRDVKAVAKANIYISSYWKQGLKEEEHKKVKSEDAA